MKLFLRIFVSFWLATVLMIGAVLGVSEFLPISFPTDRGFEPELAKAAIITAVNAYEIQGTPALSSTLQEFSGTRLKQVYLFDQDGKVLLGDNPPPFYGGLARDILQTDHSQMRRYFAAEAPERNGRMRRYRIGSQMARGTSITRRSERNCRRYGNSPP